MWRVNTGWYAWLSSTLENEKEGVIVAHLLVLRAPLQAPDGLCILLGLKTRNPAEAGFLE